MAHPIVDKIVQQGVDSINLSSLSQELRSRMMSEAGATLMRQGKYKDAGKAFAIADNKEMLREQGEWFLKQNNYGLAAYFLLHVERDEKKLSELAQQCIATNNIDAAKEIYKKLGDQTMILFIEENLHDA